MNTAAAFFDEALKTNPNAGVDTGEFEPLPEGVYPLIVESCELRKYVDGVSRKPEDIANACTNDASLRPGTEVAITFLVTEGKYAKRKIFGSYCIEASSNQKSYGDFSPEKKVQAGKNDLCGLMIRLGKPAEWKDWIGKMFSGYITAKKSADKPGHPGKIRNDLRCTVKPGEENAPKPSSPSGTTPHANPNAAPF